MQIQNYTVFINIRTTSRKVLNADLVQIKAIKEIKKSYCRNHEILT